MNHSAPTLRAISGTGGKGPACFLVEADEGRIMLDLGYGPQPGLLPNVDNIGKIDALVLSHGHRDHAGGLSLLPKVGNPPVYATETVARGLPAGIEKRTLPLRGSADVLDVRVHTGRSGHAPGGIWIHFALGDGFLYMGDHSSESIVYAYDAPLPAATVVLDASYGRDDTPVLDRFSKFDSLCASSGVLLPVPEDGRGPEIVLYLARKGCSTLRIDDAVRSALRRLAGADRASVREGVASVIAQLAETARAIDGAHGVMLASRADGTAGEAARLIEQWENTAEPAIVFTGYIPTGTPAERLMNNGRASYLRWNVHPRLSENAGLVRATHARTVVPAFCDPKDFAALSRAFDPAQVTIGCPLML